MKLYNILYHPDLYLEKAKSVTSVPEKYMRFSIEDVKTAIKEKSKTWRCNICGGLVQFDGTKPTLKVKL